VRLLLDQHLSPLLAEEPVARGHDAVHVRSLGMSTASDLMIRDLASTGARVVGSADTDFGEFLARTDVHGFPVRAVPRGGAVDSGEVEDDRYRFANLGQHRRPNVAACVEHPFPGRRSDVLAQQI
jgi:hypothetical protein